MSTEKTIAERIKLLEKEISNAETRISLHEKRLTELKKEVNNLEIILKELNATYPDYVIRFTGGNDEYHQTQKPNSLHTQGKALDFVIDSPPVTPVIRKNIIKIAKKYFLSDIAITTHATPIDTKPAIPRLVE